MSWKRTFGTFLAAALFPAGNAAGEIRFNRDVRPIFTKHCTACHGGVKEAGGISFIFRDRLLAEGESGSIPVVPGKPDLSEMIRRVKSTDPDEVMPQPKHGPPLSAGEIATLEKWIAEGAKWEEHWAFMPPVEAEVSGLKNGGWASVPFDQHVLKGIEAAGLVPSPEAGAAEWLRRVSLDLTGLPPAAEELHELEKDWETDGDAARGRVVDRLLASPAYGERWASVWLDLARYADTTGFEKDLHRDIWPWRDWVIKAFNEDKPYDQFTIEQMAGDLLPDATPDQILATAFHRNTQTNSEGGTDDEEFRVAAVIDRVSTVWTTWQATTFGCVQCHDHPYDPISHDEFYEFMDFFNSTEDSDLSNDYPKMKIAGADWVELDRETRAIRGELDAAGRAISGVKWENLSSPEFKPQHGTMRMEGTGLILSEGNLHNGTTHSLSGTSATFDALRLSIFPKSDDPKDWPEIGSLVTDFWMEKIAADGTRTPIPMAEVISDYLIGPFDPVSAFAHSPDGERFKRFLNPVSGAAGGIGEFPRLSGPRWFILLPDKRVELAEGERIGISLKQGGVANESQGAFVKKFRIETARDDRYAALRADPDRAAKWDKVSSNLDRMEEMKATQVPVMREREKPATRETRVFARGNRLTKEHVVHADVPELLRGKFQPSENADRLAMARWLVAPENPLTARVMANRLWAELFGIGIVESLEDFGTSGTVPANLALLDHIALRFRDAHGWSVKKALREMVTSSAYRQSSKASPELLERDPNNRLLARGPRNRLTAEMVRDQALAVGGLLSPKMFGPAVFPPQPAGVWSTVYSGDQWNESKDEDRVRRAIYTYVRRTSGYPSFLTFDAPSRDVCSARRINSNTPLQALVTMNDPAHMEAAAAFAKRIRARGGDLRGQLAFAVLAATQIHPDDAMLTELETLYSDLEKELRDDADARTKLGDDAAMTLTANTILNMDAALVR
jgi:hypothetical protein